MTDDVTRLPEGEAVGARGEPEPNWGGRGYAGPVRNRPDPHEEPCDCTDCAADALTREMDSREDAEIERRREQEKP